MNLTGAQEKENREAIAAAITGLSDAGNVFTRRMAFNSRKDFFEKLNVTVQNKKEIRFVEIEFLQWKDLDEGCDDEPVCTAVYGIHVFHQFINKRDDDSDSDQTFSALRLAIRNEFLYNRSFPHGESQPIREDEFAQFGNDGFVDVTGHSINFTLEVDSR